MITFQINYFDYWKKNIHYQSQKKKTRLLELEREAAKPPPIIENIKNSIIENIQVYLEKDFKPNKSIEQAKKKKY